MENEVGRKCKRKIQPSPHYITLHLSHFELFRARLGNVLEDESSLVFLDSGENPRFGEERKS